MAEAGGQNEPAENHPLISVVIATYNYAHYLDKAIRSVLSQTYPRVELIVVDDGSTDDTGTVLAQYPDIVSFYHENRGLSASRNAGIRRAQGEYIVFLDADDWLEPEALLNNYGFIKGKPGLAFVSGDFYLLSAKTGVLQPVKTVLCEAPYVRLLRSNYIGMLSSVLFKTEIVREFNFSEDLPACEDYDLFFRICRDHEVAHHNRFISTYYHHSGSLSHQYLKMVRSLQIIFHRQECLLRDQAEREAFAEGAVQWKEYQELADQQTISSS